MNMRDVVEAGMNGIRVQRVRSKPRRHVVDLAIIAEMQALLGDVPRRRDLLIEHLHKIQNRYGHIAAPHHGACIRYCTVRIKCGGDKPAHTSFGGGQALAAP